ncbi:hypothetical protein ACN2XU_09080 [Primorskyibacter sp. 2E107]|uniref:hypothetical protein n=1 Tax=Primorskyibacter sp. 2E107 TaxID=3403458 RepID=UPI003AF90FB1
MKACFCPVPAPDPARLSIPPNLPWIPRQPGRFSDYARELRQSIGAIPALDDWSTYAPRDLGRMLIEFWAVIAEVQSFYDAVRANEAYLGTARSAEALADLVAVLSHERSPAVSAQALLALQVSGVQTVTLPSATAFRSSAVAGGPPQIFETGADAALHPAFSQLDPLPPPAGTLRSALGLSAAATTVPHLYVLPDTVNLKAGELIVAETPDTLTIARVTALREDEFDDAPPLMRLSLDPALALSPDTAPEDVSLWRMSSRTRPWLTAAVSGDPAVYPAAGGEVVLETTLPQIGAGDLVTLFTPGGQDVVRVSQVGLVRMTLTAATSITAEDSEGDDLPIPIPAVRTQVTRLTLPGHARLTSNLGLLGIGYAPVSAGTLASPPATRLMASGGESLPLADGRRVRHALNAAEPQNRRVILSDRFGAGQALDAEIDPAAGVLTLGALDTPLDLAHPAQALGNVVTVTRGESVLDEMLGHGNGAVAFQRFTLGNGPLTYLEAPNEAGVAPQIEVRVDGQRIERVETLFAVAPERLVYRLRDVASDAPKVEFGDGLWGARLRTGAVVTASYRFGGGKAAPEAGSISQLVTARAEIASIAQPFAAFGGADAETPESLRDSAPASALLLGRVVSLIDFETAAALHPGVTGAEARWAWSARKQRPLVRVYVAPDPALTEGVSERLRALSDPSVPLEVVAATPLPLRLVLNVTVFDAFREVDVLAALRAALTGPGARLDFDRPEIGKALFPSVITAEAMAIEGVDRVDAITLDGGVLPQTGLAVPEGHWASIDPARGGALILNGEDGSA